MVEDQALDRVHRIGQEKEVTTVRYIVNNTLEEVRSYQHHLSYINHEGANNCIEHSPSATEEKKLGRASICSG